MRIFIDANILFSAAYLERSRTRGIFDLAGAGLCEVVTSTYAVDEARRNLLKRLPDRVRALDQITSLLKIVSEPNMEYRAWATALGVTDKDVPILAAAAQAGVDWLVSGDRGFAFLYNKKPRGVDVMLPAEAIRRLLE